MYYTLHICIIHSIYVLFRGARDRYERRESRCRANMAHIRQSSSDSGLDFKVKVRKPFEYVPASLGRGTNMAHIRQSNSDSGLGFKVKVLRPFESIPSSLGRGMGRNSDSLFPGDPDYFTEMCSGSEAGSYLRPIDFVYRSTLGLRVIKKKTGSLELEARASTRSPTLLLLDYSQA